MKWIPRRPRRHLPVVAAVVCGLIAGVALDAKAQTNVQSTGGVEIQLQEFFEAGKSLRELGDWEGALDIWEEARDELSVFDVYDPRIGFAYIDLAVENEATARYATGSQMFIWGLSGSSWEGFETVMRDEVSRIEPVLEEEEAGLWRSLLDQGSGDLLLTMKQFWIERDPTPGSDLNERLIEHIERIKYAQEHYTFNRSSPYKTDDRGITYVQYGAPGRRVSGFLGASELELQIRVPSQGFRDAMRRYDVAPQYAIWVYDNLNPDGFTYFLFGNESGTGPFVLVDGVHELIPDEAKNRGSGRYNPGGIPMEYYLELFYYEDLSLVGGHFGRRFSELDQLWNRFTFRDPDDPAIGGRAAPTEAALDAFSFRYQQTDKYFPETPAEVVLVSDFDDAPTEELVVQPVRLIRNEEPVLMITALSAPRIRVGQPAFGPNLVRVPGYWMRHSLIVRDETLAEVGRLHERVTSGRGDVSTFTLRHLQRPMHLTVVAETLSETSDEPRQGPPYPGQSHVIPGVPLSLDPEALEVSDLVLGVEVPRGVDSNALPFDLLPTNEIWRGDPVKIYLELYHLELDDDGRGRFRTSFVVTALDDDGEPDRRREPISLSLDLESQGASFDESFVIDMRDQQVGRYRLDVEIEDLLRGDVKTRSTDLELIG